jgi:hypothetical protein
LTNIGSTSYGDKKQNESIDCNNLAIEINPEDAEAFYNR